MSANKKQRTDATLDDGDRHGRGDGAAGQQQRDGEGNAEQHNGAILRWTTHEAEGSLDLDQSGVGPWMTIGRARDCPLHCTRAPAPLTTGAAYRLPLREVSRRRRIAMRWYIASSSSPSAAGASDRCSAAALTGCLPISSSGTDSLEVARVVVVPSATVIATAGETEPRGSSASSRMMSSNYPCVQSGDVANADDGGQVIASEPA